MAEARKPKRLVFCFDGTWNRLSADCLTNVAMVAQMISPIAKDGTPQLIHYDEGIGTGRSRIGRFMDGAFGGGMVEIMRSAYRFLIFNYDPGDEIFAFGFSRGAYTARTFIGLVRHAGIIDVARASRIDEAIEIYRRAPAGTGQESLEAQWFRARYSTRVCVDASDRDWRIKNVPGFVAPPEGKRQFLTFKYLGVWDTVRALGVPGFIWFAKLLNRKYEYHNAVLTSKIESARHAVAIDEQRRAFEPTLFGREKVVELNARRRGKDDPPLSPWDEPYQEKWFPGVHSAVGGGGVRRGLADAALEWVLDGARRAGLVLRDDGSDVMFTLAPDPFDTVLCDPQQSGGKPGMLDWLLKRPRLGPTDLAEISFPTLRRWQAEPLTLRESRVYRPKTLDAAAPAIARWLGTELIETKSAARFFDWHRVKRGDTLGKLAREKLGDATRRDDIFALNRDRLEEPNRLAIGMEIRIPLR